MPNGSGNFRNFQISRKKDNLERLTEIFEMNFRKFSVPFDSEPEFSEILVEWNAPHENAAWLLDTVQNGGNDVEFWASLETNFTRKTCTLEAETLVSD